MPELLLERGWRITGDASRPAAALAARELDDALSRIAGSPKREGRGLTIALAHGEETGAGFTWRATEDRLELAGDSPRGLLYCAYGVLEALGVRWAWPGPGGERFPASTALRLPDTAVSERPALPGRCLVLGHRAHLERAEDWVVWAARNRIDTLFVHVGPGRDPFGAAPQPLWLERRERIVSLAREREMTIEHGGHLLPALLDAHALERLSGGKGGMPPEAGAALERHFEAHPEADVLHLWGHDVPAGAGRRDRNRLNASEHALTVANAVADVLEQVRPDAQLAFLAYHDTLAVPRRLRPRPNVCVLWAPRERCYDHSIDDADCRENVPRYRDTFIAQIEHFRSAGAPPARVFEYYLDAILFASGIPDLGEVMARDLAFYGEHGAHTVQALMTGHGGWSEPHPNAWLFAKLAWDPGQDPTALLDEFRAATSD